MGINPRGMVPVLVDDGAVHIESNDILTYLEKKFPAPKLIPVGYEDEVAKLLRHEDDLHLDLRVLSFRFVYDRRGPVKTAEALQNYANHGSGTVGGIADPEKVHQVEFWNRINREGLSDEIIHAAAQKFRAEFDKLDRALADHPYMMGDTLSVLDIAWFVYAQRLSLGGYPFMRLHPRVAEWHRRLLARPEFARGVEMAPPVLETIATAQATHKQSGRTMEVVAGF